MNNVSKAIYQNTARQIIYLVVLSLIVVGFWKIGDIYKNGAVLENGIFEVIQSVVLALAALIFGISSLRNKELRPVLFLMSMMALSAVIREQDAFFDELIPVIGWKWCWIFPVAGIVNIIRNRSSLQTQVNTFLTSNSFHMMMTAAILMIPVAQCLGHRSFMADLLNNKMYDAVLVRRILEELVELIAYIMLVFAAIESMLEFRKK